MALVQWCCGAFYFLPPYKIVILIRQEMIKTKRKGDVLPRGKGFPLGGLEFFVTFIGLPTREGAFSQWKF